MGLNCADPLICGFFSIVNTTVIYDRIFLNSKYYSTIINTTDLGLIESKDMEPSIGRKISDMKGQQQILHRFFDCMEGWHP